jgi:hypothetical protein
LHTIRSRAKIKRWKEAKRAAIREGGGTHWSQRQLRPWKREAGCICITGLLRARISLPKRNTTEHDQLLEKITQLFATAITSISTRTSFGNRATSTVDRAGAVAPKYFA